jgi:hypothetical protein
LLARAVEWKRRKGRFGERDSGSIFSGGSAQEARKLKGAEGPDPD